MVQISVVENDSEGSGTTSSLNPKTVASEWRRSNFVRERKPDRAQPGCIELTIFRGCNEGSTVAIPKRGHVEGAIWLASFEHRALLSARRVFRGGVIVPWATSSFPRSLQYRPLCAVIHCEVCRMHQSIRKG
mmetsp:Transcript_20237/g.41465  ORF Transcript_20237/g.41465 Transcript_20237/m.41465 type:complete len:132 (+) Transcript_20237:857-1252(+)